MTPGISVIIPTLNEQDYVPSLLCSLTSALWEGCEIIVVDASEDGKTKHAIENTGISIRYFAAPEKNVSAQRNFGASKANTDTLLFLDADIVIPADFSLEAFTIKFRNESLAAATCRFEPTSGSVVGRLYLTHALYYFHRAHAFLPKAYALGAFVMADRAAFLRVGGFDPTIRVNEDAELVQRLREAGGFRVYADRVCVSTRRFEQDGYVRTTFLYLRLWAHRTFRGELRDDHIPYDFGHYDS